MATNALNQINLIIKLLYHVHELLVHGCANESEYHGILRGNSIFALLF